MVDLLIESEAEIDPADKSNVSLFQNMLLIVGVKWFASRFFFRSTG